VTCRTCFRPARHWLWWHAARSLRVHWTVPSCSLFCLTLWMERRMVDPNEQEVVAMRAAGDIAGQYIDAVGRSDMATWSEQDWRGFVEAICGAYVDALVEQQIAINTALSKVQQVPV
jgi:hypothetical protein